MQDHEDHGTYAPPTEDHLTYEPRRSSPKRDQAPITLIVSGIFLVILLIAVVIFYQSGLSRGDKAPEVGTAIEDYRDATIEEAKPLSEKELADVTGVDDHTVTQLAPKPDVIEARPQASAAAEPATPVVRTVPLETTQSSSSSTAAKSASSASSVAAAKPAAPKPVSGNIAVQIGAFNSQEAADQQYGKIASTYGMFLGGTSKRVEKVETNGKTLYRTSFTGFSDREKASEFCRALKSAGKDCMVK